MTKVFTFADKLKIRCTKMFLLVCHKQSFFAEQMILIRCWQTCGVRCRANFCNLAPITILSQTYFFCRHAFEEWIKFIVAQKLMNEAWNSTNVKRVQGKLNEKICLWTFALLKTRRKKDEKSFFVVGLWLTGCQKGKNRKTKWRNYLLINEIGHRQRIPHHDCRTLLVPNANMCRWNTIKAHFRKGFKNGFRNKREKWYEQRQIGSNIQHQNH